MHGLESLVGCTRLTSNSESLLFGAVSLQLSDGGMMHWCVSASTAMSLGSFRSSSTTKYFNVECNVAKIPGCENKTALDGRVRRSVFSPMARSFPFSSHAGMLLVVVVANNIELFVDPAKPVGATGVVYQAIRGNKT